MKSKSTFSQFRDVLIPLYDLINENEFTLKEVQEYIPNLTPQVINQMRNRMIIHLIRTTTGGIRIYQIEAFYAALVRLTKIREVREMGATV